MLAGAGDDVGAGGVARLGCAGGSEFEGAVADWFGAWLGWGEEIGLEDSFGEIGLVGWFAAVAEDDCGAAGATGAFGALLWGAGDPTGEFP
jgi:hypothetical protein